MLSISCQWLDSSLCLWEFDYYQIWEFGYCLRIVLVELNLKGNSILSIPVYEKFYVITFSNKTPTPLVLSISTSGPVPHMFSAVMLSQSTCKHCHFCLLLLLFSTPALHFQMSLSSWTLFSVTKSGINGAYCGFFLPFTTLLSSKICFEHLTLSITLPCLPGLWMCFCFIQRKLIKR